MIQIKNKICIIGETGVGKSSLLKLLQGKEVSNERTPTIGLDINTRNLGSYGKVSIWDFAGQNRFRYMWKDFLRGAGLTVLVTDSTEKNISKCKEIFERFSRHITAKIIVIANKQDLPNVLSEKEVQKRLGVRTYGMSAIRPELRQRIRDILEYEMRTD
ncbi:MAG: GTP-binding protein [Promethearchaeota archaeon]|nr:MAG: GTP-binding protein [Candidatus Lokiarchaeota archaeon]